MTERITFAIPAYDQDERYVRAALESVRNQRSTAWRAVLVDDWPIEPRYAELVRSYDDPRIVYRRNDGPHGIGAAWNVALASATTEFVTILHADDVLEPDYAETMIALADARPDGTLYVCEPTLIDEHGAAPATARNRFRDRLMALVRPPGNPYVVEGWRGIARLCVANFIICPGIMYRRSAIADRRFSHDLRFVLDLDFTIETLVRGERIYGTTARRIRYRRHAAQATAVLARSAASFDESIAYGRALRDRLRTTPYARAAAFAALAPFVRLDATVAALADVRAGRFDAGWSRLRRAFVARSR